MEGFILFFSSVKNLRSFLRAYSLYYDFCQGVNQVLFDDVYVIFPVHVNFPVTSRCVLKAIHKKKRGIVLRSWRIFFQKDAFMTLYMHVAFD